MIRRPPRSTQGVSSAASDVYKRQLLCQVIMIIFSLSSSRAFSRESTWDSVGLMIIDDLLVLLFCTCLEMRKPTRTYWPMYLSLIHISEPTRPLYISYAVFCLKKKKKKTSNPDTNKHVL
eukprot:TRINITY_DN6737_c0_g1_i3.p2 TRINITY_DN6737_c0_g1~~TRINITY_DN6737_c0_g1_i3.p2  ORF type:complete len:120 (+),score=22.97 TRINITY_DN6737_c0_g1_i3:115-474(+)